MKSKRLRLLFAVCSIVLLAVEIYIGLYVHDSFVRPYLGDMFVVMLIDCIVRTVFPTKYDWLSGAIFLFAVTVEISQIFPLCDVLHIENKLLHVLMGTSFAFEDLIAYFVGNVLTAAADIWLRSRRKTSRMLP